MSSAEERYWQNQADTHGLGALPSDMQADVLAQQQAPTYEEPADYEEPSYSYYDEPVDDGVQYGYDGQPLAPPDPWESDNFSGELEQYVDGRLAQWGDEQSPDLVEAYEAEANDYSEIAPQIEAHLTQRLGGGETAQEVASQLTPAVYVVAEDTAQQLLAELEAQGYSHQQAVEAVSPYLGQIYDASMATVREVHGSQQVLDQFRRGFRGGQ
jgi:hypothetical protein